MIAAVLRVVVVEGVRAETVLECSSLLFQGVGLRALLLEGISGGTNAILHGSSRLEEVSLRLKLLAAVGVGGVQGGGLLLQLLGGGKSFITKLDRGSRGGGAGARSGHGRVDGGSSGHAGGREGSRVTAAALGAQGGRDSRRAREK